MVLGFLFVFLFGLLGVYGLGGVKQNQKGINNAFWGDMMFLSNVDNDRLVSMDGNRRNTHQQPAPQVLMTECPVNSRCVGRNFCDQNGLITTFRNNKLKFSEDTRGFIACVDAGKNRLGVCCIDRFRVINGRRIVRQDDLLKVSDDGVISLDTLQGDLDEGLKVEQDEEEEGLLSFLDNIGDTSAGNEDDNEDPVLSLSEDDIENIVQSVKDESGISPSVVMLNSGSDSVRLLPQGGQLPGGQGGPIVVINIHAESLGLGGSRGSTLESKLRASLGGGREGPLESNIRASFAGGDTLAAVEVEKSTGDKVSNNNADEEDKQEIEDPDYLDFDTDYITITMETDYQDQSAPRRDNEGSSYHSRFRMRNRRPVRRPGRNRRPVFRFRSQQN